MCVPGETIKISDKLEADCRTVFNSAASGKRENQVGREEELYPGICYMVKQAMDHGAGGPGLSELIAKDTAHWPESASDRRCFDCSIYNESDEDAYTLDDEQEQPKIKDRAPYIGRTLFSRAVMPFEVKNDPKKRPFGDSGELLQTQEARMTRGQIAEYAAEILSRQHRSHLFFASVFQYKVNFLYIDRVSTVISESIDCQKQPKEFLQFFCRLGSMTREQLGYDPTATPASIKEIEVMRQRALRMDGYQKTYVDSAISDALEQKEKSLWPIYKLLVPPNIKDPQQIGPQAFLVGKPRSCSSSLTGRSTKGFVAYDVRKDEFVFLKDSWRADIPRGRSESDVYLMLQAAKVDNIATFRCGGDVEPRQRTKSQKYFNTETVDFIARIHHRLVIEEIGKPLDDYESAHELTQVMYGALKGHWSAYKNAEVLHRDISDGNILITYQGDEPRGILIDWDLCKTMGEIAEQKASNTNRSGTWPFLSALRILYPRKPYEVADDIESFVHIYLWFAARFHGHTLTGNRDNFATYVNDMFFQCCKEQDFYVGSSRKLSQLQAGNAGFALTGNTNLASLIDELMKVCKEHYACVDIKSMNEHYAPTCRPPAEQQTAKVKVPKLSPPPEFAEAFAANVAETASAHTVAGVPSPQRTLDNHGALFRALGLALKNDIWVINDKLPKEKDNFVGLPAVTMTEGRSIVLGTSENTSKRKAMEDNRKTTKKRKDSKTDSGSRQQTHMTRSQARAQGGLHPVQE